MGLDREDPLAALAAVRDGDEVLIDFGLVQDRVFLNNLSFGVYAQAVHEERYRQNKEATIAAALAAAAADPDAQAAIVYTTPDGARHERVPLLLISNNPYEMTGPPDFGRRVRLDSGKLGVAAVTSLPHGHDLTLRSLARAHAFYEWETTSMRLESDEPILTGLDGEALSFDSPLDISIRHQGLRVLVPAGTTVGYVPSGGDIAARLVDIAGLGGHAS